MGKYKLLALDMDGTSLTSEKKISPKTLKAISELVERGIFVVPSTGRGLSELWEYKEEQKHMSYGILVSGALVYDFREKKSLALHPLDEEQMMKILACTLEEKAMIHLLTTDESVVNPKDIENMADFQMGVYRKMFRLVTSPCEDFEKYIHENAEKILKFNIYHRSVESRARTFERLKEMNLTFAFAEGTSLECSPKGITKASGLIELCKFLNIDLSETVAVGDAQNDTEILQTAGLSVAMGNAKEEIKKIADFVTDDNDHDGVAKVIEKFF